MLHFIFISVIVKMSENWLGFHSQADGVQVHMSASTSPSWVQDCRSSRVVTSQQEQISHAEAQQGRSLRRRRWTVTAGRGGCHRWALPSSSPLPPTVLMIIPAIATLFSHVFTSLYVLLWTKRLHPSLLLASLWFAISWVRLPACLPLNNPCLMPSWLHFIFISQMQYHHCAAYYSRRVHCGYRFVRLILPLPCLALGPTKPSGPVVLDEQLDWRSHQGLAKMTFSLV